jgi:hypothetical protein
MDPAQVAFLESHPKTNSNCTIIGPDALWQSAARPACEWRFTFPAISDIPLLAEPRRADIDEDH